MFPAPTVPAREKRIRDLLSACPSPVNPLLTCRSPAAAPSRGGRKGEKRKWTQLKAPKPKLCHQHGSASAQAFLPECRSPVMSAFLPGVAAFSQLHGLCVAGPWGGERGERFWYCHQPRYADLGPAPPLPLHLQIHNVRLDLSLGGEGEALLGTSVFVPAAAPFPWPCSYTSRRRSQVASQEHPSLEPATLFQLSATFFL